MAIRMGLIAVFCGIFSAFSVLMAQKRGAESAPKPASTVTADYPSNSAGILIRDSGWISMAPEIPAKTHVKHGFAPVLTYGIAPAEAVSEYSGLHAKVQIEPGRPVICICHVISVPGTPALVKLHPKKNSRQLDGGKLHIGSKIAKAETNDLVPADVSQPEGAVWLVQPRQPLPAGEYALMLGIQNINIYPFTVTSSDTSAKR